MKHETFLKLKELLGEDRVKKDFDLSPYLTLRTHTFAEYFFEAKTRNDLINAKIDSLKLKIPLFILGGGSNLAIIKRGLKGLVVKNIYIFKKIDSISNKLIHLTVSSGYPITRLAKELSMQGIEGLDYHVGLPGTIGGAIYMNSKWTKPLSYVGDHLSSALLLDNKGREKIVSRPYFHFAYDQSILQKTDEILLEATFSLKKTGHDITKEHADFALNYRKKTQPLGVFCSGCFFKNVNGTSAGKLIDHAGLKGARIGKFHVSTKHANFIINDGDGDPISLIRLIRLIKQTVKQKFGVKLDEEVIVI